jgi:hypothetical protein
LAASSTALKVDNLEDTSDISTDLLTQRLSFQRSLLIQQASVESRTALNDRKKQTIAPVLGERDDSSSVFISPSNQSITRVASFTALQEWDGYVVSIGRASFKARLTDLTADGGADAEEVEIPLDDLADSAVSKLAEGSLFRWSIGYERSVDGQKTRVSRIILRQLPRWRASELRRAQEEATDLAKSINWK